MSRHFGYIGVNILSLCARWRFAGVFFFSLSLSSGTLSAPRWVRTRRIEKEAAVTIAGLFLGGCSDKSNVFLFIRSPPPGASGWKTGLVFTGALGHFHNAFFMALCPRVDLLQCLQAALFIFLALYATTCHCTSSSFI